jgi:hypothetical protein
MTDSARYSFAYGALVQGCKDLVRNSKSKDLAQAISGLVTATDSWLRSGLPMEAYPHDDLSKAIKSLEGRIEMYSRWHEEKVAREGFAASSVYKDLASDYRKQLSFLQSRGKE